MSHFIQTTVLGQDHCKSIHNLSTVPPRGLWLSFQNDYRNWLLIYEVPLVFQEWEFLAKLEDQVFRVSQVYQVAVDSLPQTSIASAACMLFLFSEQMEELVGDLRGPPGPPGIGKPGKLGPVGLQGRPGSTSAICGHGSFNFRCT